MDDTSPHVCFVLTGGSLTWRHTFMSSKGQEARGAHRGLARSGWVPIGRVLKTWKRAKFDNLALPVEDVALPPCMLVKHTLKSMTSREVFTRIVDTRLLLCEATGSRGPMLLVVKDPMRT